MKYLDTADYLLGGTLKGPLRDQAEALLDGARLRREGFLDPLPIL